MSDVDTEVWFEPYEDIGIQHTPFALTVGGGGGGYPTVPLGAKVLIMNNGRIIAVNPAPEE